MGDCIAVCYFLAFVSVVVKVSMMDEVNLNRMVGSDKKGGVSGSTQCTYSPYVGVHFVWAESSA